MFHPGTLKPIYCVGPDVGLMMGQITDIKARNVKPGSRPIGDGTVPGLMLMPANTKGSGKWILRFTSPTAGKRRDMGCGTYPETTIAMAREAALAARKLIACGKDPIEERNALKANQAVVRDALTFEKAAQQVHEAMKPGWKNPKHAGQWIKTLEVYAFPKIGKKRVADLTPGDFAGVLKPIWLTKPETASRVKQRCHAVIKWCCAHGHLLSNPVGVVDDLLPQQSSKRVRVAHQPSMPWRDIPDFIIKKLRIGDSNVTRALLEFVILTVARSGEARAMTWDEVDPEEEIWTVPANRMKAQVLHRVPLSTRAMEILKAQRALFPDSELVFPAPRGGILSDMVLTKFLRDQKARSSDPSRTATAHGFRSSFRDWASEQGYMRDLAERALAHTIRNAAEAAYHRTDLLDQRRPMMEAWAHHVAGSVSETQKVVQLHGRA